VIEQRGDDADVARPVGAGAIDRGLDLAVEAAAPALELLRKSMSAGVRAP
jgi:hypothetical protein